MHQQNHSGIDGEIIGDSETFFRRFSSAGGLLSQNRNCQDEPNNHLRIVASKACERAAFAAHNIAQWLARSLEQQLVVQNCGGARGGYRYHDHCQWRQLTVIAANGRVLPFSTSNAWAYCACSAIGTGHCLAKRTPTTTNFSRGQRHAEHFDRCRASTHQRHGPTLTQTMLQKSAVTLPFLH
jgi:hypothetical protein